mmetsp:Transcript_10022/g.11812  ORF Transcript_10022/g.11812 Transcript_10022/m.11812 type:complete len:145 (+) Transcript_10022:26-460(+)
MKRTAKVAACCLTAKKASAIENFSDFINGFETGVMVRDDPKAFFDYSCEKPKGDSGLATNAKSMLAPVQMMKVMMPDEKMKSMAESVELFIEAVVELEGVFMGSYDGGDFCSGMIFGKQGSKTLVAIAQRFMKIPDDHNPKMKD